MDNNILIVKNLESPMRLDRYLRSINFSMTQGLIENYLRKGKIKVNNIKATANLRINNDDRINIFGDFLTQKPENVKEYSPSIKSLSSKILEEYLIADTQHFMIINKPAGIATQGGTKISISIDDALSYINSTQEASLKLVHRLDKDTSGILIIAKSRFAAEKLMQAFRAHKIQKTYFAILSKIPEIKKDKIISYLIKEKDFEVTSYDQEVIGSKIAITEYEILKINNDKALVKFTPLTGRMHQLRVHAKKIRCPILGDQKYGGDQNKYLMLHAAQITIHKCIFNEEYFFQSPLPEYFVF